MHGFACNRTLKSLFCSEVNFACVRAVPSAVCTVQIYSEQQICRSIVQSAKIFILFI